MENIQNEVLIVASLILLGGVLVVWAFKSVTSKDKEGSNSGAGGVDPEVPTEKE